MVSLSPPIQIIVGTPTHHIEPVETRDPVVETTPNEVHQGSQVQDVAITTPVRRSTRERRSAIPKEQNFAKSRRNIADFSVIGGGRHDILHR